MWRYISTDELYHHGVKGQKWGVRHEEKPTKSDKKIMRAEKKARNKAFRKDRKTRYEVATDSTFYRNVIKTYDRHIKANEFASKKLKMDRSKQLSALKSERNAYQELNKQSIAMLKSIQKEIHNTYSDKKMMDFSTKTKKNGEEYIRGYMQDYNYVTLSRRSYTHNGEKKYHYVPTKVKYYYY